MPGNDEVIIELLLSKGLITQEQIAEAKNRADADSSSMVETLIAIRAVTEETIMMVLSAEYGMESFELSNYKIPPEVIAAIPAEIARRYRVVPVMKSGTTLTVALGDPTDIDTLDSLRYILKTDVEGVIAPKRQINDSINHNYGTIEESVESFLEDITEGTVDMGIDTPKADDEKVSEDDAPIIRLVSLIILEAFRNRASDIHLEPLEKRFRVRYRIDGLLREMENPPKYLQNNIISRIKLMATMDLSEHRVPQDGRIQIAAMGRGLDLRVSCIPCSHGESIVMRILDKTSVMLGIPELGFFTDDQETIAQVLAFPDGIFLVTGPTGSGKSTSLYAFLSSINSVHKRIITIEEPVEYELRGINQIAVRPEIGLTFAMGLRHILRQDPNVVMVGEIRDMETAEIAIRAALTGHLVFSTLHTNDAPSAFTRLIDMGIEPFLVASSVEAVMAQRLVRTICPVCKTEQKVEADFLRKVGFPLQDIPTARFWHGVGCEACRQFGYQGRKGIYELMLVKENLRPLIMGRAPASTLAAEALRNGMRTLRVDGWKKVRDGITTIEEVLRVTQIEEHLDALAEDKARAVART